MLSTLNPNEKIFAEFELIISMETSTFEQLIKIFNFSSSQFNIIFQHRSGMIIRAIYLIYSVSQLVKLTNKSPSSINKKLAEMGFPFVITGEESDVIQHYYVPLMPASQRKFWVVRRNENIPEEAIPKISFTKIENLHDLLSMDLSHKKSSIL
jgi:hypothetical protein